MTKAACIVSSGIAPGAALEGLLSRENITLAAVDLVCGEHKNKEERKYEAVLVASSTQQSREALASAARSLVPGGRLYVFEEASVSGNRFEALQRDLLLSGFTEAKQLSAGSSQPLWATATLPQWGLGASAKLSLKRSAATAAAPAPAPAAAAPAAATAVWKLDDGDEDEELLDDDALLTAEDKKAGPTVKPDDCEVGTSGRKACKNCSCGRAEAEAAGVKATLTPEMLDNPTSACGNCYLGDAFRCASCPYRGLPSFEPGQKIKLGANMLVADV